MSFFGSMFGRNPETHLKKAEEYIASSHWGEARLELDKAIRGLKDPEDPQRQEIEKKLSDVTGRLALSHEENGDHLLDSGLHEEAVERYHLAQSLFEKEEDKQRVEQKMSGQTATPQLAAQSRYFLDEHYEDRKSPSSQDEAPFEGDPLEVFEVLANTLDPDLAEEYRSLGEDFALGYAYTNHGGFKTAIKYFEKALQSHPAQRMVHRELGRALVFQGEAKHAVKELKSAIEELPEDMELHHLLASATSESGEVDTALEILKEVQTKNPEEIETYLIMGDILLKAGDITRSGEAYQKALKMDPEFSETYSRLGAWAMARGEDTLAIEHYSEAVEHGDHLQDIVTLANLYLKEERDLEGALGLLNRALYYDPQRRWHYLVQIGEVYLKKGWDDKAREVLEGVREMIPEDRKDVLEKIDAFLGD